MRSRAAPPPCCGSAKASRWDERWEVPNLGVDNLRARISEIAGARLRQSVRVAVDGGRDRHQRQDLGLPVDRGRARCASGARSAVIGTLGNGLVGERVEAKNTTPDPIVLQRLLADYLRRGARNVAMEVSSHGLDQGRVAGIKFDVAVFTNLTRDHLDYHGTMEAYAEAKFRLFATRGLKHAVVNVDDAWGATLAQRLAAGRASSSSPTAPVRARASLRFAHRALGGRRALPRRRRLGRGDVHAGVLGAFNVSNLLAVLGALHRAGHLLRRGGGAR